MLLDKLLDLLDMIVTKGVPMVIVGEIFLLLLPSMVAVVVPMAVLSGVLIAIGRLSGDMEITAMKACGIGIMRILLPLTGAAVVLGAILVVFNDSHPSHANHMAKNLLLDVGTMRPTPGSCRGCSSRTWTTTGYWWRARTTSPEGSAEWLSTRAFLERRSGPSAP